MTWHNCSLCRYFYGPTLALQSENSWYNVLIEEDLENRAGEKNDTEPHPQVQCVCAFYYSLVYIYVCLSYLLMIMLVKSYVSWFWQVSIFWRNFKFKAKWSRKHGDFYRASCPQTCIGSPYQCQNGACVNSWWAHNYTPLTRAVAGITRAHSWCCACWGLRQSENEPPLPHQTERFVVRTPGFSVFIHTHLPQSLATSDPFAVSIVWLFSFESDFSQVNITDCISNCFSLHNNLLSVYSTAYLCFIIDSTMLLTVFNIFFDILCHFHRVDFRNKTIQSRDFFLLITTVKSFKLEPI